LKSQQTAEAVSGQLLADVQETISGIVFIPITGTSGLIKNDVVITQEILPSTTRVGRPKSLE